MNRGKEAANLKDFVLSLGRQDRCILLMYYVDNLSPMEIAVVLHQTEQDVLDVVARLRKEAASRLEQANSLSTV